jgi:hypothetical protein
LSQYNSQETTPGIKQWGIVAASDHGLLYYPHNVINGEYIASEGADIDFHWGPGLIVVNGDITVMPAYNENEGIYQRATLSIADGTNVKVVPWFNVGNTAISVFKVYSKLEFKGYSDPPRLSTMDSYYFNGRTSPWSWGGIYCNFLSEGNARSYPIIHLEYCRLDSAKAPIYSENAESLAVLNSEILHGEGVGILAINGEPSTEDFSVFHINIGSSIIRDNPNCDIYIRAVAGDTCDSPVPWNPKEDPWPNFSGWWDYKNGLPDLECFTYYTVAHVNANSIDSSQTGIDISGPMVAYTFDNYLNRLDEYGMQLQSNLFVAAKRNHISNDDGLTEESGMFLNHPYLAYIEENDITDCDQAGLEIVGRIYASCSKNYLYNNSYSNLYIQNSFPFISPEILEDDADPNTLIGAEIGCYIIRSAYSYETSPVFFNNRIKSYLSHGIYVQNTASPFLGYSWGGGLDYPGNNSIANPNSTFGRNMTWSEAMPAFDIMAEDNWWGSMNQQYFRISAHIDYDPWLNFDPYPGTVPKRDNGGLELPDEISVLSAYPNPFNSQISIEFSVPRAGNVQALIFDILGRQVRNIPSSYLPAGVHRLIWDGKTNAGTTAVSGIYLVRLIQDDQSTVRKITLLK